MARKIIWSLEAANDVEAIFEYLLQTSPLYAKRFVIKTKEAANSLKTFPDRGRHVPEYPESGAREIFVDSFRFFYEAFSDRVEIKGVIHMARDITRLGILE
jgi:plasmid stabilization system protein ParE